MPFVLLAVLLLAGCAAPPQTVVYQYNYQAEPQTGPASPPIGEPVHPPTPVRYRIVYPARPFDDPTTVILKNVSLRARMTITIDDGEPFLLEPGDITANIKLDLGDHEVKIKRVITTGLGEKRVTDELLPIRIAPRGRTQILHLNE